MKDIVSSPGFDRLRKTHNSAYEKFFQEKVIPIYGDLVFHSTLPL